MIANDQDSQVKEGGLLRRQTGTLSVVDQVIVTVSVCVVLVLVDFIRSHTNLSHVNEGLRNTSIGQCFTGAHGLADRSSRPEHRRTLARNESELL